MCKCPYCGFDNEDGTLFCEQCKSDLSVMQAADIPEAVAVDVSAENSAPVDPPEANEATAEQPVLSSGNAEDSTQIETPVPQEVAAGQPTVPAVSEPLPEGSQPKLVVLRGQRIHVEYPILEGENYIGRTDEQPVDIDLEDQEPPDRIWSSRQHAVIRFVAGIMEIEDLNSSNGTFVNRMRVYPNQKKSLAPGDILQVGTVQLRVQL